MNTCIDCNWFGTRESHCSKHHKKVNPHDFACGDLWLIVRPIPSLAIEGEIETKICPDCSEKGYSVWNEFKYCPICGKELKR